MMGKIAKVIRCVSTLAVGGRSACKRATTASTSCSVKIMSEFQSKNRSTSAEPRLVTEVTFLRPGTLFTASSMGRVMVTSIWSMGITPLSTPTTTRGKSVFGNTEMGMVRARRSEEHTSELQSLTNLVCRLLLEKKINIVNTLDHVSFALCYETDHTFISG